MIQNLLQVQGACAIRGHFLQSSHKAAHSAQQAAKRVGANANHTPPSPRGVPNPRTSTSCYSALFMNLRLANTSQNLLATPSGDW